jgi:RNA polymerase sigma factor (sigma-70 family)
MTDADPFEAFVREHQHLVYAVAIRLLGRPAEAEDVAQDVFLKAFERFDALRTSPSAAGWLRTVTRNSCLNHLARYRSRWRLFSEMSSPEHPGGGAVLRAAAGLGSLGGPGARACGRTRAGRDGAARPAGSSTRAAGALPLRRAELRGDRRDAGCHAREGEERHPPWARSVAEVVGCDEAPWIPLTSSV